MKETGLMTNNMVKVMRTQPEGAVTLASTSSARSMDVANSNLMTARYTKVNLWTTNLKGLVFMIGLMGVDMRVSGKTIKCMVEVSTHGPTE